MPDGFDFYKWFLGDALKPDKRSKKKHITGCVRCEKCKRSGVTLRKINDEYFCNDCYKEKKNGR